jgi:hypothetical protein
MLKLSTKCWISAFNAQGVRGIIVGCTGRMYRWEQWKSYVAAVEPLKKNERQGETQGETQETINFTLWMTKLRVLGALFSSINGYISLYILCKIFFLDSLCFGVGQNGWPLVITRWPPNPKHTHTHTHKRFSSRLFPPPSIENLRPCCLSWSANN